MICDGPFPIGPPTMTLRSRTLCEVYQVSQCVPLTKRSKMGPPTFLLVIVLVTRAGNTLSDMAIANVTTPSSDTADIDPTTQVDEMTEETILTAPPPLPSSTKPKRKETPQGDQPWQHGNTGHRNSNPGRCLYYSEPLKCFAKIESRGLNWLKLAAEYNSSFETDFPDTCRYTTDAFRCTIPLSGHLATILRTMSHYNMNYQIKLSDRGPYRLHLDIITGLNDVISLLDLFSAGNSTNIPAKCLEPRVCHI